jgi:negative regulator of sigma E activity
MICPRLFSSYAIVVVFLLASSPSHGQASAEILDKIHAAEEAQDWNSARVEINKLRVADPTQFRAKGYDYLLARIAGTPATLRLPPGNMKP